MSAGRTPIEVHEAFVPTDEEQRFVESILAQAKQYAEAGSFRPMAFMIGADESLTVIPMVGFDWGDNRSKDVAAAVLHELATAARPKYFAFVSDAWMREFADRKAIEAAGLDPRQYHKWRQEDLDRFMVKREVIMVTLETKERQFLLAQFYQRDFKGQPIWEETKLSDQTGAVEGRFTGMLRGDQ